MSCRPSYLDGHSAMKLESQAAQPIRVKGTRGLYIWVYTHQAAWRQRIGRAREEGRGGWGGAKHDITTFLFSSKRSYPISVYANVECTIIQR